jgi:hypothetical protein
MEPQLPTNFRTGTESIQKLEEALYKRDEILSEEEKPDPPRFTVELKVCTVCATDIRHFKYESQTGRDATVQLAVRLPTPLTCILFVVMDSFCTLHSLSYFIPDIA